MRSIAFCLGAGLLALGSPAALAADNTAAEPGFWQRSRDNVEATWRSERYELYVPAVTWHNRAFYDRAKIDSFNERPWGLGFGRYRYDADGDWHALYAMAFLDSHKDVEPFVGYAYQKTWWPLDGWRLGAGFTAGVTARSDYSYIPLPAVLPLVSVEYRRLALQATYIPGGHNNGNVLFAWLRWQLD
ncbi:phospholipid:lipid A palmitoyltransferase [Chromobacterium sp. LK1]|uniref:lipid IV(A) palmitoyltransferase PagP n=1 Tax=Chromobacterium sp. LK1 TaxID=1628193 RepID=UPI00065314DE|nr:lipid IV(A) palmitoyltransferase PagP [Chromobacterium sp. LK1]KMN37974.1 phospholipid:lipid A palmitoyltransferase [Chromobacterium sp. LK1]